MKKLQITKSYSVVVPEDAFLERDAQVNSLWRGGSSVLLQFSSYARVEGAQVSATERLRDRLKDTENATSFLISIPECDDTAAAIRKDNDGVEWLHVYAVWEDLCIYSTITFKQPDKLMTTGSWALKALSSVSRV